MRNYFSSTKLLNLSGIAAMTLAIALFVAAPANSCPFCSAVARTFTEQMDSSDIVVVASLQSEPEGTDQTQLPRAIFSVANIMKGEEVLTIGDEFKAVVVSRNMEIGDKFLVMGNGTDAINWTTPLAVSDTVIEYLTQLDELPEKGADRLAFFSKFFEHEESVLAYDAYDEFARAPYDDVKALKDRLDRDQLIGWLKDPEVMKSRKRLYYTLLGVCGTEKELAFLEDVIQSGDRDRQGGLDALIACYLTLTGDEGVKLIEDTFLKNPEAEYIDVFSTITAMRFHGTESEILSKPRIVEALRYVLDRPKMADMVIPDLARWEDWSVMERLVQMFKDCSSDETRWVRTPIISYLQACPRDEAKACIAELREIDPDAAKRADMLAELDWSDEEDEEEEDEEDDTDVNEPAEDSGNKVEAEADKKSEESTEEKDSKVTTVLRPAIQDAQDDRYDDLDQSSSDSANQPTTSYVSTNSETTLDSNVGRMQNSPEQLAQRTRPTPPAAAIVSSSPSTLVMVLVSLGICAILFVLLWSVLNGTFERLIV